MSEQLPAPRIGDLERNQAVDALREHMVAGRLDEVEFDERIGTALTARTKAELDALFTDLPAPHPGDAVAAVPAPAATGSSVTKPQYRPEPWWTHWSLFFVAVVLSGVSRLELGWLVPVAAVWVWWLGPTIWRDQERRRIAAEERRELGR